MGYKFDKEKGWHFVQEQGELPLTNYGYSVPGALASDRRDWSRGSNTYIGYTPPPAKPEVPLSIKIPIERALMDYRVDFNGDIMEAELPPSKLVHLFQHDGIYAAIDLSFARLCVQHTEDEWKGQYQAIKPGFKLKIPKLPGHMYAQILAFFRHYVIDLKIHGVTEAMSQIYWDNETQEYFINIPEQEVTGGAVRYNFDKQDPRTLKKSVVRVFDIHSHNTMSSFFSGVDDGDEKGRQFYGVIGEIDKDSHTHKFRIGINGDYCEVKAEDIIDFSTFQETGVEFPQVWRGKVTIPAATYQNLLEDEETIGGNRHVRFRKDHTSDRPSMVVLGGEDDPDFLEDSMVPGAETDPVKEEIVELIEDLEKPTQVRYLVKKLMASVHGDLVMEAMAHIAILRRKRQRGR